jgi:transcriptional regulator with XRE-family HTH domain
MKPKVKIFARPELRLMRARRLLPLEEVANAVNVSSCYYAMVERGDRSCSPKLARNIVRYYRLPESAFNDVFRFAMTGIKHENPTIAS